MKAAAIGLGKIGLPAAFQFAGSGLETSEQDVDPVATVDHASITLPHGRQLHSRLSGPATCQPVIKSIFARGSMTDVAERREWVAASTATDRSPRGVWAQQAGRWESRSWTILDFRS